MVIEILSVSCSVLFFSKDRWRPFCGAKLQKNQNGLMQRFFQFYTLLVLVRDAILKVYSHLILKQLIARIILTQIWSNSLAVIKILSFSCSALSLVTANGGHLGMPNCKTSKRLHRRNILARTWISTNQWFLSYRHFHCLYAIFSKGPWRPSWIVNLHKYEMVSLRDYYDKI